MSRKQKVTPNPAWWPARFKQASPKIFSKYEFPSHHLIIDSRRAGAGGRADRLSLSVRECRAARIAQRPYNGRRCRATRNTQIGHVREEQGHAHSAVTEWGEVDGPAPRQPAPKDRRRHSLPQIPVVFHVSCVLQHVSTPRPAPDRNREPRGTKHRCQSGLVPLLHNAWIVPQYQSRFSA